MAAASWLFRLPVSSVAGVMRAVMQRSKKDWKRSIAIDFRNTGVQAFIQQST